LIDLSVGQIFNADGKATGIVVIVQDIIRLKQFS